MIHLFTTFVSQTGFANIGWQELTMLAVGALLIYLGIARQYEPLLLVPIGFGAILVNLPLTGLLQSDGLLRYFYFGIQSGVFPPLIFLGVGALTDFGPLISKPYTLLLGAAAQIGIFGTLLGAKLLGFDFREAASIAIIGGADGPTAIYLTSRLASQLLGPVAVAAYSYMALVPIIQPPIIRLLTNKAERRIVMTRVKPVSKRVKITFPIVTTLVALLVVPKAAPLIGMLMLGNLFREAGVLERLAKSAQNEFINIVTVLLALSVGSKMAADQFLRVDTILILLLGLIAFAIGTASGVLFGKLMCLVTRGKINPMIGAAGVSAVPMSARVVQKVGQAENPGNYLLMNAMGPNVAGVIGSAAAAGILLAVVQ